MEKPEFNFKLAGMEVLQSEIVELKAKHDSSINFYFDISLEMKINQKEEAILIAPMVKIRIDEKSEHIGKLKIALVFKIKSFQDYYIPETKNIKLSKDIHNVLSSISISTLRGVMFNHFKGTYLHNAILPIIDPKSFRIN